MWRLRSWLGLGLDCTSGKKNRCGMMSSGRSSGNLEHVIGFGLVFRLSSFQLPILERSD